MQNSHVESLDPDWLGLVASTVLNSGILNGDIESHVRTAFSKVDQRAFINPNHALTPSRLPLMVRMTALINLTKRMRILVAGVGDGYLCGVLSAAQAEVFGVERVAATAQAARKKLDALGFNRVIINRADGNRGWEEMAPFDGIIVTHQVIDELNLPIAQLARHGSLVAPVQIDDAVRLTVWKRHADDSFKRIVFEVVEGAGG
jgi:protein-L-isoaspartate(D-aspartate) O-methyltransferase